jgi:TPR repeat protein
MVIRNASKVIVISTVLCGFICGCGQDRSGPSEREIKLRAAADAGDAQALLELGWAYSFGDEDPNPPESLRPYIIPGIHKDDIESARLVELSAEKGNSTAEGLICTIYYRKKDYAKCIYWAKKAAEQQNKVGIDMLSGLRTTVTMDPKMFADPDAAAKEAREISKALKDAGLE